MGLFLDEVVQLFLQLEEIGFLRVLIEGQLRLFHRLAEIGVLHAAEEGAVLRLPEADLKKLAAREFHLAFLGVLLGLRDEAVAQHVLAADQLLDEGLVALVLVIALRSGDGATDDQRRPGFIDEDGVDLIHDGKVVTALHLLGLVRGHAVVTEVVEAELAVGAVGDVALVLGAADVRRLIVLNAADAEAEELEEVAHPLGVASGQVVVDGDDVDAAAGEGIERDGKGSHQGLAFPRGHFRNHPAVQGHTTDELDVKVDHVPRQRLIADRQLATAETTGRVFHDRVALGHDLIENLGLDVGELGLDLVPSLAGFVDRGLLLIERGLLPSAVAEVVDIEGGEVLLQSHHGLFDGLEAGIDGGFVGDAERDAPEEGGGVEDAKALLPLGGALAKGVF